MRNFIYPNDNPILEKFFRKNINARPKDFEKECKLKIVSNSAFGALRRKVAKELGVSFIPSAPGNPTGEKRSYTKRSNTYTKRSNTYITIYEDELPKTFMQSKGMEIIDEVTKAISKSLGTNIQILKMADPSGIEVRMAV